MTESGTKSRSVDRPSENDVLFGRGHFNQNHPGNRYFRNIVEQHKTAYTQTTKINDKDAISKHIYQSIKKLNPPGRFLKRGDGEKYHISIQKDALTKIKQALRENTYVSKRKKTDNVRCIQGKNLEITRDDMKKLVCLILDMK